MCGLIAQIKKKDDGVPTHDTIKGMLASQINRGREGFGYIAFDKEIFSYVRRETRSEIERILDMNSKRSIIFHHRIPTSTPNLADCTHPIKVSNPELDYDYYLAHNGMISNDTILKKEHESLGYEYNTFVENTIKTKNFCDTYSKFNDSEALTIDVARFLDGKQDSIKARGSIAFICAQTDKETGEVLNVYFGRNSSPITMKLTANSLILRSEGEKDSVPAHFMHCLNMKTFKVSKEPCQIGEIGSVRNDISQGYGRVSSIYYDRDWDNDRDDTPVGRPVSSQFDYSKDGTSHEVILADEYIADMFTRQEVDKIDRLLEQLDDKLDIACEDLAIFQGGEGGFEDEIRQCQDDIAKIEDDIEKFGLDRELLMNGDLDEAMTET